VRTVSVAAAGDSLQARRAKGSYVVASLPTWATAGIADRWYSGGVQAASSVGEAERGIAAAGLGRVMERTDHVRVFYFCST
jgi:hypothetical protein